MVLAAKAAKRGSKQGCRKGLAYVQKGAGLAPTSAALAGIGRHLGRCAFSPASLAFEDTLRTGGKAPSMLTIPAGKFRMGDLNKAGDADEQPIRVVALKAAFAVSVTEVTFAQYDVFTTAAGREPPSDEKLGRDDRPVINVTWQDANDYAGWLSEQTGHVYRLPSESEWEYVARANTETTRPWGDDANKACDYANVADLDLKGVMPKYQAPVHQCSDKNSFTAAVGSYRANEFGVSDMLGNVLEWTSDCWSASYTGAPDDGRPVDPENCKERVIRGGSWLLFPKAVRSANRLKFSPQQGNKQLGIRLIRELR